MRIERLILQDFRGIHELELELSGKSTILYGINGVGKSSILSSINLLYANIINKIVNQKFKQSIKFEESDIKYKKASATVTAEFGFEDTKETFCFCRQNSRSNVKVIKPVINQFDKLIGHFNQLYIGMVTVDAWQRKIINVLKDTFPNIQFIITTHSPQVLGEISTEFNVVSLRRERDEILCEVVCPYYGVDTNTVLEDAMDTDSVSHIVKEKINNMYTLLDNKNYEEAEKLADEIDQITLNRNVDTVRARIIIRKGKRLNAVYTKESRT